MEINRDIIKSLVQTRGYEHLEALMKAEMVKMRDVLNIKAEDGRTMELEVIAKQEAYQMMERFFRKIGIIKSELKPPVRRSMK